MPGLLRVPTVAVLFWIVKGLSTAMGEATSDALVFSPLGPQIAVALGFVVFLLALAIQFRQRRYRAWSYWFAVCMVGVFGTMAADVMHVALNVPYVASSILYAVLLAAVFVIWRRVEGTLSIHSIDTPRREGFYWAAVIATFAMGTALGDFTAVTLNLGFFPSAALFAGMILVPLLGWRFLRWNAVACFWSSYVMTRPLGASIADGLSKPKNATGLGLGDGAVALALIAALVVLIAYLAITKKDVQNEPLTSLTERDPATPAAINPSRAQAAALPRRTHVPVSTVAINPCVEQPTNRLQRPRMSTPPPRPTLGFPASDAGQGGLGARDRVPQRLPQRPPARRVRRGVMPIVDPEKLPFSDPP
jgi:uncharacterized membrane-anchored protein